MNERKEKELLEDFEKQYGDVIDFFACTPYKNPDVGFNCTINGQKYSFFLESKVYNQSNTSNYPKQLLSEILINRNLDKSKFNLKGEISYGILLTYDNSQFDGIYNTLQSFYLLNDWNKFGEIFGCKFIFLYDRKNKKLYFCKWKDFLNKDLLQIKEI